LGEGVGEEGKSNRRVSCWPSVGKLRAWLIVIVFTQALNGRPFDRSDHTLMRAVEFTSGSDGAGV
jgi:hypothetical protein